MKARYQVRINLKGQTYLELCHGLRDAIEKLEDHLHHGPPRKATTSWLSDGEYSMTISTKDASPVERVGITDPISREWDTPEEDEAWKDL